MEILPVGLGVQKLEEAAALYMLGEARGTLAMADFGEHAPLLDLIMTRLYELAEFSKSAKGYVLTAKGKEALKKLVAMTDAVMRLEIFGSVDLSADLGDLADPQNPGQIVALGYDPRFPESGGEDMRLAMYTFLSEHLKEQLKGAVIDPHLIVFLQKIGSGEYNANTEALWDEVRDGTAFAQIDAIVQSAYQWTDMAPGDPAAACDCMLGLYAAGMTEMRKRVGDKCGGCEAPLAILDEQATAQGRTLDACPNCGRVFGSAGGVGLAVAEYSCPKCGADVSASDRVCRGCGATIDFGMAAGTIAQDHLEVLEPVPVGPYCGWSYAYDYGYEPAPYGWYSDPFYDLAAITLLACVFW